MKKLIISAVIALTLFACTKEEDPQTNSVVEKTTTNVIRYAYDRTDDGIENFIEPPQQDYHYVYFFEYRSADKKVTISALENNVKKLLETYTVDSNKDGNLKCHNDYTSSVFRFIAMDEVDQIIKVENGEKKIRYINRP